MKNILKKIHNRSERGQAIIIIAFAIVGLVAIVGLMTDSGILLIQYARLKRGIDSASIAAASQFRKPPEIGNTAANIKMGTDMQKAGEEFLQFNQTVADVTIETCDYPGTTHNAELCKENTGGVARKLVLVTASQHVDFGFMRILGINGTTITARSRGEAASIDLVLAIDTSASMAFETTVGGNPNQSDAAVPGTHAGDDPAACNSDPGRRCEPMGKVKDAALNFVNQLFYPYDRVALVATTEQNAGGNRYPVLVPAGVSFSDNLSNAVPPVANTEVQDAVSALKVFQPATCPAPNSKGGCLNREPGHYVGLSCTPFVTNGDPSTCQSSNIGGGLKLAGEQFANARQDSFWVVIALIGGPANATSDINGSNNQNGFCPGSLGNPTWNWGGNGSGYCRFRDSTPYNPLTDRHWTTINNTIPASPVIVYPTNYDPDDYARDMADAIAAPNPKGQGATLFAICMGSYCQNYPSPDPYSAEHLGQYMALQAGDDPSATPPITANHGLYFYAEDPNALGGVFEKIAENIFTRISQ